MAATDPAVRVRSLSKGFDGGPRKGPDGGPVFDGVDLDAARGEVTLLMGPNGAGKTILLSCIAGGLSPDSGDVEVFGRAPREAREDLSFMLQDGMLVDELTGRENVSFLEGLHPHSTDRWRDVLDDLDFDRDALDREVKDYSGGMARKLELAVTLGVDAPLYLLDEPTAGLDLTTVDAVHSLLAERADAGDAVLLTSHIPVDAQLADRIVFVREHGVVADGVPEELLDAVPPVVHVGGVVDGVDEHVVDGRLFESGAERRGFLRDDADPDAVEGVADRPGATVRVTEPTVTDLFNYYVHVAPGE
ncbi:MAG: ABC transporter ATP-binding protein [Haloarculaceae archaeon]